MKRNWIELNGVRSETLNGLLISELPPITKPLMRTQIDEIDGRDGSIVTDLGYSAYDREMIIGLFGDYDIDEVVRFFNSSGTAIFSNEPDKVYQYRIHNEIDFERLAHFRTATVTFYCQPFKHSAVEPERVLTSSNGYVYNNGNVPAKPILTLTGTGTVTLSLNGSQVLIIANGSSTRTITIDVEAMNAYNGNTLLNRIVSGDYSDLTLPVGENRIQWTGSVSSFKIDKYSRWV